MIFVRGIVQGVGFRPFVFNLAQRLTLGGFVRNETGGVRIEVEGADAALDEFLHNLRHQLPPLARIDGLQITEQPARGELVFQIISSESCSGEITITPDAATCEHCLKELFDPADRRFSYPFTNCTHCGPRLTIILGAPYDRARTTMASFKMCARCQAEYDDPTDRRFHAQPNACPDCGPKISAHASDGSPVETSEPLAWFAKQISMGRIGAMKGLGGYHLICDANNTIAVATLRARKHRDEKPFAVMVASVQSARALCEIDDDEEKLLQPPRCPIVLLQKRTDCPLAAAIAPGNPNLGVMLPYTPLHHLLLHEMNGVPLVMTSGNRSDEPIAYDDHDAIKSLNGIADIFLSHDRPIHVRCDDSVTRMIGAEESPIRRSRGTAPQPVALPIECPKSILAVGGQLKNTFALANGRRAIVSQHVGDLDHLEAFRAFERDIKLFEELFALKPQAIIHDLHPDYASTRYALKRAATENIRTIGVQHHHAHLASCMVEHGLNEPVIGVIFDGTGFGPDGTIWGGEFLVGDYRAFLRVAHLRTVPLPGGDAAVREPWRMAAAHLMDAGAACEKFTNRHSAESLQTIRKMIVRRLNSPLTSSAGRLFDAVAALIGVRDRVTYEGQAAIELEQLAKMTSPEIPYPMEFIDTLIDGDQNSPLTVDTRELIVQIASDVDARVSPAKIARRFHSTLAHLIANVCIRVRAKNGLNAVICSGGSFMNSLLSTETGELLTQNGFRVFQHHAVPPNDGGLSLGQVAIAAAQLPIDC